MKEMSIVTWLDQILSHEEINIMLHQIKSHRLLFVNRPYMCSEQIGGYPLSYVCLKSPELKNMIERLEISLLSNALLYNTRIIERGIGILNDDILLENVTDKKELDLYSKHVRIPLAGQSTINDITLYAGAAYIIDNISGYKFEATKNSTHLVFNFINNDEKRKPWELWKNIE